MKSRWGLPRCVHDHKDTMMVVAASTRESLKLMVALVSRITLKHDDDKPGSDNCDGCVEHTSSSGLAR